MATTISTRTIIVLDDCGRFQMMDESQQYEHCNINIILSAC